MLFQSIYAEMETNQALVPPDTNVKLIMRHSLREEIKDPIEHRLAMLTPEGIQLAQTFGREIRCTLGEVCASPIPRCMDTGRAILSGYAEHYRHTKYPDAIPCPELYGCYISDEDAAMKEVASRGDMQLLRDICSGKPVPGCTSLQQATDAILDKVFAQEHGGCLDIYVTHDFHLTLLITRLFPWLHQGLLKKAEGSTDNPWVKWPNMMEGILLWGNRRQFTAAWRNTRRHIDTARESAGTGQQY